ncbi:DUF3301 domain-containing protein [Spongiibacter sp. KMU-166]|uniref:DUF3301 domain-containing protein n=1 Tax=Spongiibacter thalassae TaxID=2721624 RepID=A0ABX1GM00_9GAMM|nr:DUF3301 domain-containing protein [Spongiibacter thalassae]
MLELSDLLLLLLVFAALLLTWSSLGARERALIAVRHHLKNQGLQLLDDNVALRALWLKRNPQGELKFWRRYHFEFSSLGDERYQGRIILLGQYTESIHLQAYRLPDERLH